MKFFTFLTIQLLATAACFAQSPVAGAPVAASTVAHAHNDYVHPRPFHEAAALGFGSIEADVWLVNDTLFVAHDKKDIRPARTLSTLYLEPIAAWRKTNPTVPLHLLVDLKTGGETLRALERRCNRTGRFLRGKMPSASS